MKKTKINETFERKVQEMEDDDRRYEMELQTRHLRKCNLMRNIIIAFQTENVDVGEAVHILESTMTYMQKYASSNSVPLDVDKRCPF